MPIKTNKFEDIVLKLIDYAVYFEQIKQEFTALISTQLTNGNKDEALVQQYLEQNPTAIVGLLDELPASYNIMGGVIISQPLIKSYSGDRKPDFLVITGNSLELYFNFIELESPAKKFFHPTKPQVSSEFADALNQVYEWKAFTEDHYKTFCKEMIYKVFPNQADMTKSKKWFINHVLVYGDAKEIADKNDDKFRALIENRMPGIKLVTYSRLLRQFKLKYPLLTITFKGKSNQYEAIGMTPYRNYGMDEWLNYHLILNKQETVTKDRFLSDAEKTELNASITRLDKMTEKEIWDDDDLTSTDFPVI